MKAQLLLANERLMYWKRSAGFKRYVFIAKYSKDGENVNRDAEAFNNKFRQIKTQISDIEHEVHKQIGKVKKDVMEKFQIDRKAMEESMSTF